jgi:hypothetical protein
VNDDEAYRSGQPPLIGCEEGTEMARIVWGTPPWPSAPGAQASTDPLLPGNSAVVVATASPAELAGKATSITSGGDRLITTMQGKQFYFPFRVEREGDEQDHVTAEVWSFLHAGADLQVRAGSAIDGAVRPAYARASVMGRALVTGPGPGNVTLVASLKGEGEVSTNQARLEDGRVVVDEAGFTLISWIVGASYRLTMALWVSAATRAHEVPTDVVPALAHSRLKVDENSPGFEVRLAIAT